MKKILILLLGVVAVTSCTKEKTIKNTQISGEIKGLKQGTVYIQQLKDSTLITLDSIVLKGTSNFYSTFDLEEPEVLFLGLNRGTSHSLDSLILFFAEPGNIKINSSLNNFSADAVIEGSKNQELYSKYLESRRALNHKSTDLIKAIVLAQKNDLLNKADSLEQVLSRNNRMLYLNAVNFVVKNKNYEVAPYITLTDIVPLSSNKLDTIYDNFSPEVAQSKYGEILKSYIDLIKQAQP